MLFGCWGGKHDPGPCPVDDTPHTACTPESVALQRATGGTRIVVPVEPPQQFTTATYKRAIHGKALGIDTRGRR